MAQIPEELGDFIRKKAEKQNFEIVHIGARSGGSFAVEIVLDKEDGITIDDCAHFNREVAGWMEEKRIVGEKFTLDVCSPGLDRELKSADEFMWARGKLVNIITIDKEGKQVENIGKLVKKTPIYGISIEKEDGSVVSIEESKVICARREVEL